MKVLPGYCLISFDKDEEMTKFGLIIPAIARRLARTAFVHLHEPIFVEDLNNKHVVVDRWASRPFNVIKDGKEYTFHRIPETCVLAVIEQE